MIIPDHIKAAYRKAILDYGARYWAKHVAAEIADHAEEEVERMPGNVSKGFGDVEFVLLGDRSHTFTGESQGYTINPEVMP